MKSATYVFESFSLQYVASAILDRGKLIHDVDNRGEEITRLFFQDKVALAKYNLEDCRLVWEIFCETDLVSFAVERAKMTGLAIDRFGGSVAAFDNRYLPLLHRRGFVAPVLQENPEGIGSPGGYVMDSKPGLYQHVLVLDFKSLYPSIIRSFKIDPLALAFAAHDDMASCSRDQLETKILDTDIYSAGFNGAAFDKIQSILPDLIDELWLERDRAKRENNKTMSQAIKILMNSFYGVLGTPGCRFFDYRLPSSITLRGHHILTETKKQVEARGLEVIYGDTDSLFIWVKDCKSSTVESVFELGAQLADDLNNWWKTKLKDDYQLDCHLELEFETYFSEFVMPTIRGAETGSKKRYAGKKATLNGEGDSEIVFKGLEAVRTDWTPLAREFQKELYRRIFFHEPYDDYILSTVKKVYEGHYDDALVYRKRLRRHLSDYTSNVPPHVQAARMAEQKLRAVGKNSRYSRGSWIQYVMTVSGPEPLDFRESPLDYERYVERQLIPIADGILHFLDRSFDQIAGKQLGLF